MQKLNSGGATPRARSCRSFALALAVLLVASTARAQPARPRVHLTYETAPGCPSRAAFEEEVAARLGYLPFDASSRSSVAVQALIDGADQAQAQVSFRLVLATAPPRVATKRIDSGDCAEAMRAAAASLALALDPMFAPAPARPPVAEPDRSSHIDPAPESLVAPAPPPSATDIRPAADAETFFELGLAPAITFGGAVHVGVKRGPFRLIGGARAQTTAVESSRRGATIRASAWAGEVLLCVQHTYAFGCAGVTVGRFRAEAEAAGRITADATVYETINARAGLAVPVMGSINATLAPMFALPLETLVVQRDGKTLYHTTPLLMGAALGMNASF